MNFGQSKLKPQHEGGRKFENTIPFMSSIAECFIRAVSRTIWITHIRRYLRVQRGADYPLPPPPTALSMRPHLSNEWKQISRLSLQCCLKGLHMCSGWECTGKYLPCKVAETLAPLYMCIGHCTDMSLFQSRSVL